MARVQLKRGAKANLPISGMLAGEAHYTTDRKTLHVADDATTTSPVVPPIEVLAEISAVDLATDWLLIHDASASGVKEKKVRVGALVASAEKDVLQMMLSGPGDAVTTGVKGGVRVRRAGVVTSVNLDCSPNDEPSGSAVSVDVRVVNRSTGAKTDVLSSAIAIAIGANAATGAIDTAADDVSAGSYLEIEVNQGDVGCRDLSVFIEITPT